MKCYCVFDRQVIMIVFAFVIILSVLGVSSSEIVISKGNTAYDAKWDCLDSRPLPAWYDQAKIGIFMHWGVFSVPSFGSEWFWANWKSSSSNSYSEYMRKNYPPNFTYQDFARYFTTDFFNATDWAQIFSDSGAKYVVLTSKHHEGYTLWPSTYSYSWNSMDVGPHRDLIGELSAAIKHTDLKFGLYYSLMEWFHPLYLADKSSNYTRADFVHRKVLPELTELVEKYKPQVLWSDGDWEATDEYFQSKEFLAWLYNESEVRDTIVVNDRWGRDIPCHHGGFYTCQDRFNPGVLQPHKWENAMTIDRKSWGFRREAKLEDYMSTHELITTLIETISCGGNILMNVGPTKDGIIPPIFQQRLSDIGHWLKVNGDAIYASTPWDFQNDTLGSVWYTAKENTVYATTLVWPEKNVLALEKVLPLFNSSETVVHILGINDKLKWKTTDKEVQINFPDKASVKSDWAWVVKITNFKK